MVMANGRLRAVYERLRQTTEISTCDVDGALPSFMLQFVPDFWDSFPSFGGRG